MMITQANIEDAPILIAEHLQRCKKYRRGMIVVDAEEMDRCLKLPRGATMQHVDEAAINVGLTVLSKGKAKVALQ